MSNNLNDNKIGLSVDEQNQYLQSAQPKRLELDKSQKIAISVLAFFAILVIFIWIAQTKRSLSRPFDNNILNQASTCSSGNCSLANEEDLRLKDTDKDGLNDYDELNIYNTSPYLEDSDSDGYSDKQEVQSQNDPNCPFGQQCHNEFPVKDNQKDNLSEVQKQSDSLDNNFESIISAKKTLDGQGNPDTLRSMLIGSGMDPKVLEQISDEDLMASYQDILSN